EGVKKEAPIELEGGDLPVGHVERHPRNPCELHDLVNAVRLLRQLPHCAGGEDECQQQHSRADQPDQKLQAWSMMVRMHTMGVVMHMIVVVVLSMVPLAVMMPVFLMLMPV